MLLRLIRRYRHALGRRGRDVVEEPGREASAARRSLARRREMAGAGLGGAHRCAVISAEVHREVPARTGEQASSTLTDAESACAAGALERGVRIGEGASSAETVGRNAGACG
jgi:hypothetical protein